MALIRRKYEAVKSKGGEGTYVIVETRPGYTGWELVGQFPDQFSADEAVDAIERALDQFIRDNNLNEES